MVNQLNRNIEQIQNNKHMLIQWYWFAYLDFVVLLFINNMKGRDWDLIWLLFPSMLLEGLTITSIISVNVLVVHSGIRKRTAPECYTRWSKVAPSFDCHRKCLKQARLCKGGTVCFLWSGSWFLYITRWNLWCMVLRIQSKCWAKGKFSASRSLSAHLVSSPLLWSMNCVLNTTNPTQHAWTPVKGTSAWRIIWLHSIRTEIIEIGLNL
jgi:hypothetical protein